jgi:colicin import membrane protein
MNDLIPLENPDPPALFRPGGLDQILARVEAEARSLVPDLTTVKGRSAIASTAAKVAKTKTYLDGLGKDLTADLKRQTGAVDAERRAMRERLDALKAEVRKPLDDWEQAEVDRVAKIRSRIATFAADPRGLSGAEYQSAIDSIDSIAIDDSFAEFSAEAQQAKDACLYRLSRQRDIALAREDEAARVEAERQAAAAKAQAEREERIAREAAERAIRQAQAERDAIAREQAEAIARAKREKEAAEQRAMDAEKKAMRDAAFAKVRQERAVRAEQERIAAEQRAREDADVKRAEDEAHREQIHAEIAEDMRSVAMTEYGDLVAAISAGKIRHLKIEY